MEGKEQEKKINEKSKTARVIKEIFEWAFCFVMAYVIYVNVSFFFGTISGVKQVSMYPTAKEGEKILIQRPTVFKKELTHGQIITFEAPIDTEKKSDNNIAKYNQYNGFDSFIYNYMGIGKRSYIKRIIGLPGDHILIAEDGNVYRNNEKLEEPYLKDGWTNKLGEYFDLVVPDGTVFAMGDNRLESRDSRAFGCIPIDKIDGYVITRVWPLNRLGDV